MSKIRLTCPEAEKNTEISSQDATVVEWSNADQEAAGYQLRYVCPICEVIELNPVEEFQADVLVAGGCGRETITKPILENGGNSEPIKHDELIDFHFELENHQ